MWRCKMIREEVKQLVKQKFEDGHPVYKIGKIVGISTQSVYNILKSENYNNKCKRCGCVIKPRWNKKGRNFSYCEICRKIVNSELVMNSYQRRKKINDQTIQKVSIGDKSTHGDIYALNHRLGTSNLANHYDDIEEEWKAIVKEHDSLFSNNFEYKGKKKGLELQDEDL